jgi:very-short-patch-repair endonuclease
MKPEGFSGIRPHAASAPDGGGLLWRHLQNRELAACKFRRQVPIGPYIADFVCFAARLVIGGERRPARDP